MSSVQKNKSRNGSGSSVCVLSSNSTYRQYCKEAIRNRQVYQFSGAKGKVTWLKGHYAYLAVNGAATFLRRFGIPFAIIQEQDIDHSHGALLEGCRILFVPNAARLSAATINAIEQWMKEDKTRFLIVTGLTNLPASLLGAKREKTISLEQYAGLTWQGKGIPLVPPQYPLNVLIPDKEARTEGTTISFPSRSPLSVPLPTMISTKQALYIPLPIFESLGAFLQAHLPSQAFPKPLNQFLAIEEMVKVIADILRKKVPILFHTRIMPWGNAKGIVVFRHDTDWSRDTTYLEIEKEQGIPATYSILLDNNRVFWLEKTAKLPEIEQSFHYYTCKREQAPLTKVQDMLTHKLLGKKSMTRIDRRAMQGKGLYQQLCKAEQKGIRSETIHRHAKFFLYPELVDAMEYVYEKKPSLLGMGSMFRFEYYGYGKFRYSVKHPHNPVPFLFPYRLVYSTTQRHASLRGWESTHYMEASPSLIDMLFSTPVENPVIVLNYHPSHAQQSEFNPTGNRQWYRYAITKAKRENFSFLNYRQLYHRLSLLEQIKIVQQGNEVWVENQHTGLIENVCLTVGKKSFSFDLRAKERHCI